jgi:hypothetical protein
VVSTQAQFTGPVGAMFWHFPGFLADVVHAALEHFFPLPVAVQGPAATKPIFCTSPANPLNDEHVPP